MANNDTRTVVPPYREIIFDFKSSARPRVSGTLISAIRNRRLPPKNDDFRSPTTPYYLENEISRFSPRARLTTRIVQTVVRNVRITRVFARNFARRAVPKRPAKKTTPAMMINRTCEYRFRDTGRCCINTE